MNSENVVDEQENRGVREDFVLMRETWVSPCQRLP